MREEGVDVKLAPCGHPGEPIIGQFVNCKTCNNVPELVLDEETTEPFVFAKRCPDCNSIDVAVFDVDGNTEHDHCWTCGKIFKVRS